MTRNERQRYQTFLIGVMFVNLIGMNFFSGVEVRVSAGSTAICAMLTCIWIELSKP